MAPRFLPLLLAVAALSAGAAAHEGHEDASASSGTSVEVVGNECNSTVSDPIVTTIDNSTFFSTCAEAEEGVTFNVSSLFDVLNFTSADFIAFCNSSTCLEPVHEMLHSIPTDCLISYDGSDRNLSAEVTAIHDSCHEVLEGDEEASGSTESASTDNAAPARFALAPTALAIAFAAASVMASIVI